MFFLRFSSFLALVILVIFAPAVFVLFSVALATAFFSKFLEGVIIGVVMDSFYAVPPFFDKFGIGFFTFLAVVIVLLGEVVKHFVQGRNFISKLAIAAMNWAWIATLFILFF